MWTQSACKLCCELRSYVKRRICVATATAVLDMFLQSLRLFTKDETNRDIFNIRITVEATQPRDPPWKHTVHLNRSNFAELHQFDVILLILKKKTLEICEYMM